MERELKSILALCENPHWTTERRWRIAQLAREAIAQLEHHNKTGMPLDSEEGTVSDD